MSELVTAPWTPEQVDALNRWQHACVVHPFTCPNHSGLRDTDRALVATVSGWVCTHCDYRQNWAHAFMTEPVPPMPFPRRQGGYPCVRRHRLAPPYSF